MPCDSTSRHVAVGNAGKRDGEKLFETARNGRVARRGGAAAATASQLVGGLVVEDGLEARVVLAVDQAYTPSAAAARPSASPTRSRRERCGGLATNATPTCTTKSTERPTRMPALNVPTALLLCTAGL